MLCLDNFVDEVDNHTSGFDQQKTKSHVNPHLEPSCDDKGGCAPIFCKIGYVELKSHGKVSRNGICIVLDNPRKNDGGVVLRQENLFNTLGEPLHDGREEMVPPSAESGSGIHHAADAGTAAVVDVHAKLQLDVRHAGLDCNWENRTMDVAAECTGIVQEDDAFLVTL